MKEYRLTLQEIDGNKLSHVSDVIITEQNFRTPAEALNDPISQQAYALLWLNLLNPRKLVT